MYTVLSLINISKYMHYSDFKVCKYNNYKYYAELKARQLVTLYNWSIIYWLLLNLSFSNYERFNLGLVSTN